MISVTIDNIRLEVPEGSILIRAAREAGIEIPALCDYDGLEHFTSCMICVVKDVRTGKLIPSCSIPAMEGMEIITNDEEIHSSRKAALELLLSDHTGDCQAPCQLACPAHMDIPLMNRLLSEGKVDEALRVVEQDIPIPGVLGRICHAPCEGACRRRTIDASVSVCLLKRFAGDFGKREGPPANASEEKGTIHGGKKGSVAVIGAGPAGLTASWYLQRMGHQCILFDRNKRAGGLLHEAGQGEEGYHQVLEREVNRILASGIEFRSGISVDGKLFRKILESHDAVVIATGAIDDAQREWGLDAGPSGFSIERRTYRTSSEKTFAVGNAVRSVRSAVRSVGHGKEAATAVHQFLSEEAVTGHPRPFNSRFGKLLEEEFAEYLKEASPGKRTRPDRGDREGFSMAEVMAEASRCMHCDCRDIHHCLLRDYSGRYDADQRRYSRETRKKVTKILIGGTVIHEPSKCIKCGICVRLAETKKEKFGFTFIGRGFDVRVGIPLGEHLEKSLKDLAEQAAHACPTGALALKQ